MGVFDKRSFIAENEQEWATSLVWASSTTASEEREGVQAIPVNVQAEASHLFVAVGGAGDTFAVTEPSGVTHVELLDPDGQSVQAVAPEVGVYGRFIFIVEAPRQGLWQALVRHTKDSAFVVRACALRDGAIEEIRARWPKIACSGCKECFQAVIAAAVFFIAGAIAGVATPTALIGVVAARFRLPERVVEHIIKRMFDVSLDRLIEEACVRMEMCSPA
jgi:hypothetical protein